MFAFRTLSGIASIRPAPKFGVGMRKTMLERLEKSGCSTLHPPESDRPRTVNNACTPPSGEPSGLRRKRASRIGPSLERNHGMVLVARIAVAIAICGFSLGLVPPTAGNAWHPAQ